jgi:DNA-binding protein HU-beta
VIKLDIINEVVARTGITKTKAELAVETVFESMKNALARGNRIELRGFGVFNVRPRKTGIGRNPRTGARYRFLRARRCGSSRGRNCSRLIEGKLEDFDFRML